MLLYNRGNANKLEKLKCRVCSYRSFDSEYHQGEMPDKLNSSLKKRGMIISVS